MKLGKSTIQSDGGSVTVGYCKDGKRLRVKAVCQMYRTADKTAYMCWRKSKYKQVNLE